MNSANMPRLETYTLHDTEPTIDVFRSTDGWYWNWHGEVTAYGPFDTKEAAETDARKEG